MPLLALLAGDRVLERRLTASMDPEVALAQSRSWGGLNRVIRERPVTGAFVNLQAVPHYPTVERALVSLRSQFPHLGLVILLQNVKEPFTLFRLGRAGIRNLVLLPVEEIRNGLSRTLAKASEGGAASIVARGLSPFLSPREMRLVLLAMNSVHLRWSAEEMADYVGLSRPHLSEVFRRVGLPSLGRFLLWTRLFYAGHWLEEPGRTGESVARQLEYSSGAAFRRALKLYTGATPTQVSERGGLRFVFRNFLARSGLPQPMSRPALIGRLPNRRQARRARSWVSAG